jgi:hypothetical protein
MNVNDIWCTLQSTDLNTERPDFTGSHSKTPNPYKSDITTSVCQVFTKTLYVTTVFELLNMSLWAQHQKSFRFWQHIQLRPVGSLLTAEHFCLNKKKEAMEGEELAYFKNILTFWRRRFIKLHFVKSWTIIYCALRTRRAVLLTAS